MRKSFRFRLLSAAIVLSVVSSSANVVRGQQVLKCGSVVSAAVGQDRQVTYFFDGLAGDVVGLMAVTTDTGASGGFRARVEVFGPSKAAAAIVSFKADYTVDQWVTLPEDGRYTVTVRDNASFYSGRYELALYWWSPVEKRCWNSTLFCSTTYSASLGRTKSHYHRFWARGGDIVKLSAVTTDDGSYPDLFRVRCTVYQPDLETVLLDVTANLSTTQTFEIPEDGEYTVYCRASNRSYSGKYNLSLHRVNPPCAAAAWFRKITPPTTREGLFTVEVPIKNVVSILGGQMGFRFDRDVLTLVSVEPGADLPEGAQIYFDPDAAMETCSDDPVLDGGAVIGWVNSEDGSVALAPGTYTLFQLQFEWAPEASPRDCTQLRFSDCVGGNVLPSSANRVTNTGDKSFLINAFYNQSTCVPPEDPFRRGDANDDGLFDISDVIGILRCTFHGELCSGCLDAMDSNDDGKVDIGDAIYLINWRFKDGSVPPAPFPSCGADPTNEDDHILCEYTSC